ncbi:non-reducing end alpha-L-arabinofuranosidase family hydrolase [Streptomyces sp. NPDC060028]|uniref:non-reducing end alpha-L-arabinofuranosidase family hydrolase n=1 Tax=Streptomyces sp. NPDC060028 TaxID=3347041 RepID=UPI00369A253E
MDHQPVGSSALPSTFRWSSRGVLAGPKPDARHADVAAIKDFSIVRYNNQWLTFATTPSPSGWGLAQFSFSDAALADASLTRYRPNVVTLEIGTNDLNGSYQPATAAARLKSLVNQITAAAPDATVLVASLVVSTSGSEEQYRAAYNQAVPQIVSEAQAAGKHVAYVDMSSLTTADLADTLHPNDTGYQKMADAFHRGVQAVDAAGWLKNPAPAAARVESGISGKCLDVNGAGTADGTAAQIWGCSGGANQLWSAYTDGTLRSMGKCLDAAGGGTANGTKVQIWACHGGANQVWQPYNGGYRNSASGRCLDDPGFSTTDGTQLHLWDCQGSSNQKWTTLTAG